MCFVLYMASNKSRREIEWDSSAPAFHVTSADAEDAHNTRPHFSKPHIFYLGSSSQCGCDFRRDLDWVFEQRDNTEKEKISDNQTRLHTYLRECLTDEDSLELFGCWSGDESKMLQSKRIIHVDDLLNSDFFFDDSKTELITITKEGEHVPPGGRGEAPRP